MFILRFYVRASRFEDFVQKPSMVGVLKKIPIVNNFKRFTHIDD